MQSYFEVMITELASSYLEVAEKVTVKVSNKLQYTSLSIVYRYSKVTTILDHRESYLEVRIADLRPEAT